MKKTHFFAFFFLLVCFNLPLSSQTTRYFQFNLFCGGGFWQDTSFIAAATEPALINAVLSEMEKPYQERVFILGTIAKGDGGFNFNADHRFNWHFVIDKWELAEVAVEVCDGCPYSNVESDVDYWVNDVGYFCPWNSKPVREITLTSLPDTKEEGEIKVFPNPTSGKTYFKQPLEEPFSVELRNLSNTQLRYFPKRNQEEIDLSDYPAGMYVLIFSNEKEWKSQKIVIAR